MRFFNLDFWERAAPFQEFFRRVLMREDFCADNFQKVCRFSAVALRHIGRIFEELLFEPLNNNLCADSFDAFCWIDDDFSAAKFYAQIF